MEDIDIIKQLMSGNHLEPKELKRAWFLVGAFRMDIERRMGKPLKDFLAEHRRK